MLTTAQDRIAVDQYYVVFYDVGMYVGRITELIEDNKARVKFPKEEVDSD